MMKANRCIVQKNYIFRSHSYFHLIFRRAYSRLRVAIVIFVDVGKLRLGQFEGCAEVEVTGKS